ncbi:MAG: HD domain-containing protein [Sandaracinaceae bacterium]
MRRQLPKDPLPCVAVGFGLLELRRALRRLGRRPGHEVDVAALAPPDSGLCARAEDLARAWHREALLGHGFRTWAFATAVAEAVGLAPDPEVLFVACLLHDVGLEPEAPGDAPFELVGARRAHELCLPDEARAELVHDAIAMHTSLRALFGPAEQRLVQSGSGCDLVGLDAELLAPTTRRAVRARWPGSPAHFREVGDRLKARTSLYPGSPGATLVQLGFIGRIEAGAKGA